MGITKPTATLLLDTRNLKQNGAYPIKLTIYYQGKKKRYSLPFDFTISEWKKLNSPKLRDIKLKDAKTKLDFYVGEKFNNALLKITEPFTFNKFEKEYFFDNHYTKVNFSVFDAFDDYIQKLEREDRIGTSIFYRTAKKSLQKFRKTLKFPDVTKAFLTQYEEFMHTLGRTQNYISMNIRCLRAIYNQAIIAGVANQTDFPFTQKRNDGKFVIRKGQNIKKALTIDQLRALKYHKASSPAQQKALDLWFFSFYCNGLNMIDICKLRHQDIVGNKIIVNRTKTKNSTNSKKTIRIQLLPEIEEIIKKYGTLTHATNTHIFDILPTVCSAKRERDIVQSLTRNINKHMKQISKDLSFERTISSYWARHSFSTFLKRSGVSVDIISECLGHTSTSTTQHYLDSFTDETIQETANLLSSI